MIPFILLFQAGPAQKGFVGKVIGNVMASVEAKFSKRKAAQLGQTNLFVSRETTLLWAARSLRRLHNKVSSMEDEVKSSISKVARITPQSPQWTSAQKELQTTLTKFESLFKSDIDQLVQVDYQIESTMNLLTHTAMEQLASALVEANKAGLDPRLFGELRMRLNALEQQVESVADRLRLQETRQARGATTFAQYSLDPRKWISSFMLRGERYEAKQVRRVARREVADLAEMSHAFNQGDEEAFTKLFMQIIEEAGEEIKDLEEISDDNILLAYRLRKILLNLKSLLDGMPREAYNSLANERRRIDALLAYEQQKLDEIRRTMVELNVVIRQQLARIRV